MDLDLGDLNNNQLEALNWDQGPLLVLAGPGSGKTRVLTVRVAKLILSSPGERFRVLALTFTNKAAAEMRTRVDAMIHSNRERALLTTFHSFAADVLRQHGSHIGIKPDFAILNQDRDREALLIDAIEALRASGVDTSEQDVQLLPLIDDLLSNCIAVGEVSAKIKNPQLAQKLAALYGEYRLQLTANNRLDFPSLLCCVSELFAAVPAIAKQLRMVYRHVCVDEFQDCNSAQCLVLRALVGDKPRNLFIVADDDQMIYQWNGASPERLEELQKDYGMHVIQLPTSYRCPVEVIALANVLIQHNLNRSFDKQPLSAWKKSDGTYPVCVKGFSDFAEEAAWVATDIARRPAQERGGCAVLGRTRKLLEFAARALEKEGLRPSLPVKKNEFETPAFRWLHGMLRLANARGDREQLRRVCRAFRDLEGINADVQSIIAYSSSLGGDYLRSWVELVLEGAELEPGARQLLMRARSLVVDRLDFSGFIQESLAWFEETQASAAHESTEFWAGFVEEKETWCELERQVLGKYGKDQVTLQVLLQEFDLSAKSAPVRPDAVSCLTIHTAKGLEFNHVYLIGMVEDQLPSYASLKRGPQSYELQEERRNCFVAITRCYSTLTMTFAAEYFGWQKRPSRFLREMGLIQ